MNTTTKRKHQQKAATKPVAVAASPETVDKETAAANATMVLRPSVNAAVVIDEYSKPFGEQDLGALVDSLSAGMQEVWAGDLKRAEAMLYGQAHALQAIFMNFSRRALKQEYQKNLESFLRIALKAQNQCRMTLETLATVKNPPIVIARQANINHGGQQQVNNGAQMDDAMVAQARTRETENQLEKTELLEASDGERLDTRTTSAASRANSQLETVGTGNRPAHR